MRQAAPLLLLRLSDLVQSREQNQRNILEPFVRKDRRVKIGCTLKADIGITSIAETESRKLPFDRPCRRRRRVPGERLLVNGSNWR